jgi:hypothetical protein
VVRLRQQISLLLFMIIASTGAAGVSGAVDDEETAPAPDKDDRLVRA